MHNFVIIPDSACDLTAPLRERFDIPAFIRGVVYYPNGKQTLADVDWESITPADYYTSMKGRNVLYKTASAPLGEIQSVYEPFLQQGQDILSVSLSSALSGTYHSCRIVAKELMKKYPKRKIVCVDSLRYASAFALLLVKASEKRRAGATLEETAAFLETERYCVHQMGPLDDLFFCVKTGRVSNFKALFGTLVGVNCLGDFDKSGLSGVIGKTKGKRDAIEATVRYMARTIKKPENQIIFIGHSNRVETADLLAERIKREFNPKEILINPIGMSCGASIGPGLCAAYYMGTPISDNMLHEKKVMDAVLQEIKKK